MLDRRAIALLGGVGLTGILAKQAEAATPFSTYSYSPTLPDGTSSTPGSQTTLAQLGEIFANVKSFGAKGDNSTDDTSAIQAAINWTAGSSRAIVFFPQGTYIISSPLTFDSGMSIILQGTGFGSTISSSTVGDFLLKRTGANNDGNNMCVIRDLALSNTAQNGGGILFADTTVGGLISNVYIAADMGISCCLVSATAATSQPTASGTTLHFSATPQDVINVFNTGNGSNISVKDLTAPSSISGGTTVSGVTTTTVTLSGSVAGTVGSGDSIQFQFTNNIANGSAFSVVIDRCTIGPAHTAAPGSFGIAITENSAIRACEFHNFDVAIFMAGIGNTVANCRLEVNRQGIVLGGVPNGTAATGITGSPIISSALGGFTIDGTGMESNGIAINCESCSQGVISGVTTRAFPGAAPYTGNTVSGISITGSISGATGTAAIAYSYTQSNWVLTLSSVGGTFQVGDFFGDGTNIPLRTKISSFITGSGGSGSTAVVVGSPEYGISSNFGIGAGSVAFIGCNMGANFNTAAIVAGATSATPINRQDNTFIGCSVSNNIGTGVQLPLTAGQATFINCSGISNPIYTFANLPAPPLVSTDDEFIISNSSTTTFGATADGAGTNQVKVRVSKIVSGTTNNTTSTSSNALHFASTPSGITNGMTVGDQTVLNNGLQAFPAGTTVTGQTGSTVTVSNNAMNTIGNGDTIEFVLWTVSGI